MLCGMNECVFACVRVYVCSILLIELPFIVIISIVVAVLLLLWFFFTFFCM